MPPVKRKTTTDANPKQMKLAPIFNQGGPKTKMGTWECMKNMWIYTSNDVKSQAKVASFDMDSTLITTASGRVFPKDPTDWKLLYDCIPKKLQDLAKDDFKLVIFTNQKGLEVGKVNPNEFKKKIESVVERMKVPMQVFISLGHPTFRKPYVGMWDYFVGESNDSLAIDFENSIYVGDAAGRLVSSTRKKKDHSDADKLFALNIKIKFATPEEFFLKQFTKELFADIPFDPVNYLAQKMPKFVPADTQLGKDKQEMVILVGLPASGKSSLAQEWEAKHDYGVINRDTLGTQEKCLKIANQMIEQGKSVVIDNTNMDPASRKKYIDLAAKSNIPVRCFHLNLTLNHCMHNNAFRQIIGTDEAHHGINKMVIHRLQSSYKKPELSENFESIVTVNFVPNFENEEHTKIYNYHLPY
uniref:Bifunctional polynucleotide phosphatase/kinase n=1 Tax=Rhabditophanes sp. KR3021 TaxID=114890 RepID=A0AC35UIN9_9BILA